MMLTLALVIEIGWRLAVTLFATALLLAVGLSPQ